MKTTCPDCAQPFTIPSADVWWLADGKRRNPALKIICAKCGRKEVERLDKLRRHK